MSLLMTFKPITSAKRIKIFILLFKKSLNSSKVYYFTKVNML